jgi:bifunctional DNA-binding transcriptional regulator/antitoxin component of YhaV-PrlF toxin-antitoxin module
MSQTFRARLDARGRITLSRALRNHLAVEEGDAVVFRITSGTVVVESLAGAKAQVLRDQETVQEGESAGEIRAFYGDRPAPLPDGVVAATAEELATADAIDT